MKKEHLDDYGQFVLIAQAENPDAQWHDVATACAKLFKLAQQLRNRYTAMCSYPYADTESYLKRTEILERKADAVAATVGLKVRHNRDPRGCALKLQTPNSERYNSMGGREDGWGIA